MSSRIAYDEIVVDDVKYAVSTINRQSSCMYGGVFAETMVFKGGIPGEIIQQFEGPEGSRATHDRVCEMIRSRTAGHEQ